MNFDNLDYYLKVAVGTLIVGVVVCGALALGSALMFLPASWSH